MIRVSGPRELQGYKKNLARGAERSSKQSYPKRGAESVTKFERRLVKLEKRMGAVEGRNNSMWRRFIEGGFFTGT